MSRGALQQARAYSLVANPAVLVVQKHGRLLRPVATVDWEARQGPEDLPRKLGGARR